ncbi:MAG: DUF1207 domain-containing protein [Ignavibacteriaceae bacterium]
MRKCSLFLLLLVAVPNFSFAQSSDTWFPNKLNIKPFTANILEARDGFSYLFGEQKIRLNAGLSSDIYQVQNGNSTLSFGADIFTFTRLRSEDNFRFPVETIDYFFGINSGYKIIQGAQEYGFRIRLSHISAHLVDGSYDGQDSVWRNGRAPFVYSREFIEVLPFYKINSFRVYGGFTYLFHRIPATIGKGIYQAGFDYYMVNLAGNNVTPFLADDFKLTEIVKYTGNNVIEAGIKFGSYDGKGFSILLSYTSGKSIHGLYYDLNENYASLGFNFDL